MGVATCMILLSISANLPMFISLAEARIICTLDGSRCKNSSRKSEFVDGRSSTQQLLHFAKQLGGFAVFQFLSHEELSDLLALRIGYARDKLIFHFLVRIILGRVNEEILDFCGVFRG